MHFSMIEKADVKMTTHQDDEEIKDDLKDEWQNGFCLWQGCQFCIEGATIVAPFFICAFRTYMWRLQQ